MEKIMHCLIFLEKVTKYSATKFSPENLLFGVRSIIGPVELLEKNFNLEKSTGEAVINSTNKYE